MTDDMKQGAIANVNGKIFEKQLIPLFEEHGYEVVLFSEFQKRGVPFEELPKTVIRQVPFNSIYHHKGRTEFLLVNNEKDRRIRIECKWQQSAGSVDEKLPYLYLNCVYGFEETDIILLVDGAGFKPGAVEWLKTNVKSRWLLEEDNPKQIQVMSIAEFTAYFNKYLR